MMRRRINRKRLGWQLLAVSLVLGAASVPYSVAAQETKASSSEDSEESESKEEYKNMNIGLRMEKQLLAAILEKKSRYQFQNIWMEHW